MLNIDFSKKVVIQTQDMPWQASPAEGVVRKPLAREAAESGHATSVVMYEPGASFSRHEHPYGEEILVLSGTFSDETGDYHAGTYFRNPPGTGHAPFSKEGCTLLVKLHQFHPADKTPVCIDTNTGNWQLGDNGLQVMPLHQFDSELARETTALIRYQPGERFLLPAHDGGEEIFVLSGTFKTEHEIYPQHTWIRNPAPSPSTAGSNSANSTTNNQLAEQETILWIKTGHLN